MCSVEDDFENDRVESVKPKLTLNSDCKKCSERKAVIVLQKRHCYCRPCFLSMVTHKFRSTLGKTKLMKHEEKVLIVFYGDQNSVAILHLLEQGILESTHKRIRFKPVILYIDESALWSSKMDKPAILTDVWKYLNCSFDCYLTKLSSVYEDNHSFVNIHDIEPSQVIELNENDDKLKNSLLGIRSSTSKIDFLLKLRYLIQVDIARKLQCTKIFTPECGTDLSINLLSDVILGRGSQISSDVAVCDSKIIDLPVLRPLREITSKEITFYNVFNKLKCGFVPSPTAMFNSSNSIQQVTESFVYELQEEFPSTVYTIFHTGDKLKISDNQDKQNICMLCHNKIDSAALQFILNSNKKEKSCNNCSCSKEKAGPLEIINTLQNALCYGCNRLINDMNSLDALPFDIIEKAKLSLQAEQMRNKIEDFLL